jgi:general secretion pathway protein L
MRAQFDQLTRGARRRAAEIVIELPQDRVLRREIDLPVVVTENLREVLSFEIDRHTPFQAEEVAFDYRVLRTDAAAQRIAVELAVVPRAMLDQAVALANALGAPPDRVAVGGDAGQLNLLRQMEADIDERPGLRLAPALAGLAIILAAIAIYLPLRAQQRMAEALAREVAESRAAVADIETLRVRATAALERTQFLSDQRAGKPSFVSLLNEITERLPDGTWLTQLRMQGNQVTFTGFSPEAAALVAGLEDSPQLSEVRFASPVTVDPHVGLERFNLSATVTASPDT